MNRKALSDVVNMGGLALQSEDCALRAAVAHRGEHGGIVRIENERYHQFVIWRALLPFWHATIERQSLTDLILKSDDEEHFFEFKNWRRDPAPFISKDVAKLQSKQHGYIILTSGNPTFDRPQRTNENLDFLKEKLTGIDWSTNIVFRFKTQNKRDEEIEYWIAGWQVIR